MKIRDALHLLGIGKKHKVSERTGLTWDTAPIRANNISAKTVIDVGAAGGTPALYDLFPDAYFYMIEPLRDFEPDLAKVLERHSGEVFWKAAGAEPSVATLTVNPEVPMQSSLMNRTRIAKHTEQRSIPVDSLDNMLSGKTIEEPCFLKIDVEGYESQVLAGAQNTLSRVGALVIEINCDVNYKRLVNNVASVDTTLQHAGFGLAGLLHVSMNRKTLVVSKFDALYIRREGKSAAVTLPS